MLGRGSEEGPIRMPHGPPPACTSCTPGLASWVGFCLGAGHLFWVCQLSPSSHCLRLYDRIQDLLLGPLTPSFLPQSLCPFREPTSSHHGTRSGQGSQACGIRSPCLWSRGVSRSEMMPPGQALPVSVQGAWCMPSSGEPASTRSHHLPDLNVPICKAGRGSVW